MRKTLPGEFTPHTLTLLNACPRCGGELRALIMVARGACEPKKQVCVTQCGFDKDISKPKPGAKA